MNDVALTETARLAASIHSKHLEVQRLGRTAKEIAAEIGEDLLKAKEKAGHGKFMEWVEVNCSFTHKRAKEYMIVARSRKHSRVLFDRCTSIREVLALGKPKPAPKVEPRAATLNDLRTVERLRALRDDPSAPEGERVNAQAKLTKIEKEVGPVEVVKEQPRRASTTSRRQETRNKACTIMDKLTPIIKPKVRSGVINALMIAYGDNPERLDEILEALTD